jgi:two-component system LytT family response regulator
VRTLLVDDEPLARERLRALLADEPRIAIVGEAENGRSAVARIQELSPDLVFLDVQMPGMDGFGVLRALDPERFPLVVFVTAHDEHAIPAFDVNAVDYVLKPVMEDRLYKAVHRVLARFDLRSTNLTAQLLTVLERVRRLDDDERIPVRVGGNTLFVRTDQLDWAEVVEDYVRLHVGAESYLLRETMSELERRLPAHRFLRIHRSTLVNVSRIKQVQPWSKGDYLLVLDDGTKLVTGKTYRERIQQLLR